MFYLCLPAHPEDLVRSPKEMRKKLGAFSIWSRPDFQAPRIGGKLQVESSCLSASKLAFWVLGRDSVWKLLLLRTYAKQRQEIPKYRCGLDQIVAAVHIQKYNKHTKKQPSRAHPSMFYNVSKGCGKALPVKAFVQFLARASRIQNSWREFFGVAFLGLKQKQQQICTSMCGHGVSTVSTRDSNMLHWDRVDEEELPQSQANALATLADTP